MQLGEQNLEAEADVNVIKIKHKGDFSNTEKFMNRVLKRDYLNILAEYGKRGVNALSANTPAQSGKTADSWDYGIDVENGKVTLYWTNSNENEGVNIAILLIYGHGTQNGSYVQGINFVDPVMQPLFDQMARETWDRVIK